MTNARTAPNEVGASRRLAARAECNLPATALFNGVELCDAIIKDISTTGLRLFIPNKVWLPSDFEVLTPALGGRPIKVRTRWSEGDWVGVRFIFN